MVKFCLSSIKAMLLAATMTLACLAAESLPKNISTIFSETFGEAKNPAILLNAGAGGQSIHWPTQFCTLLAKKGYFVIRYDYRDTGLSYAVDYDKNPYSVMDLAQDAVKVLETHGVKNAHIVGFSMGGQLAQLMGAFFAEHVQSLILLGTSTDFKPGFDAFVGIRRTEGLSPPDPNYIKWATRSFDFSHQTLDEKVSDYVKTWEVLAGSPPDFDAAFFREQGLETYTRTTLHQPYVNHAKAMKATYELHKRAPTMIIAPTLIIQGSKDPVFPPDHGQALAQKIPGSKLMLVDDLAHAITLQNFEELVTLINDFIKSQS
jgi:pimeloyl-ACP methyl ester carboxylesterase